MNQEESSDIKPNEEAPKSTSLSVETSPQNPKERERNPIKRFLNMLGPGLITGASDDDPSGIGTYSVAGASLGYATLWTAIVTLPLMIAVQYTCAKIGMVCGEGLAGVLKQFYSKKWLYPAVIGVVIANTINAGADIGAIAAAVNLFVPIPSVLTIILIAVIIVAFQILGSYHILEKIFKWLALTLFAYIGAALFAHPNWTEVIKSTFIPPLRFDSAYLVTLVAILGTTISPYLFFWQTSEEVEEEKSEGRTTLDERKGATKAELRFAEWDTVIGMIFCNMVFYFVILSSAATLHAAGKTDIQSATDAAEALRPLAGNGATLLFALGLIGAGFLAVPVLTGSSAYAISETFNWTSGLDEKPRNAKRFYAVIAVTTFLGMLINFLGINPIKALFWTAVINGMVSPPLLLVIMLVANNKEVMGENVNGPLANFAGWTATVLMFAAAIGMLLTWSS